MICFTPKSLLCSQKKPIGLQIAFFINNNLSFNFRLLKPPSGVPVEKEKRKKDQSSYSLNENHTAPRSSLDRAAVHRYINRTMPLLGATQIEQQHTGISGEPYSSKEQLRQRSSSQYINRTILHLGETQIEQQYTGISAEPYSSKEQFSRAAVFEFINFHLRSN